MKQNPSRRQTSTSYLDTLRSELDALTQQLQESETAASTAQQEADAKRRAYHELEKRSNSTHWSVTEQRLFRENPARAAVARHRAGFSREQGRYEIEIPVETLEVANTVLDADLSAR
jgi:septal ring factor EnvC (AmiA/AmiB activator)